jgi:NAD(P)-dependent dehydrogenase (short-subunit alcohol dehydrogenase family)
MGTIDCGPDTGVLITGGASGIGLATAKAVATAGRPVALWDLRTDRAEEAAAAVAAEHGVVTVGLGVDVRASSVLPDAVRRSVAAIGTIGGLVHAAGVSGAGGPGGVDVVTDEAWDAVLAVNLRAYAMIFQALLPELLANAPGAAAVGISSIYGIIAGPESPAYSASKAGLLGLTRTMAVRYAAEGIRVNAICPGFIDTPMVPDVAEMRARMARSAPMARLGRAEEIGTAARFLLSDDASFVTGTQLVVDGGVVISDH